MASRMFVYVRGSENMDKYITCRLCMCDSDPLINIFEGNSRFGFIAAELIADLIQIEVSASDIYPEVICGLCLEKLAQFKDFKESCINTKTRFDSEYHSRKNSRENYNEERVEDQPHRIVTNFQDGVLIKEEIYLGNDPAEEEDIHCTPVNNSSDGKYVTDDNRSGNKPAEVENVSRREEENDNPEDWDFMNKKIKVEQPEETPNDNEEYPFENLEEENVSERRNNDETDPFACVQEDDEKEFDPIVPKTEDSDHSIEEDDPKSPAEWDSDENIRCSSAQSTEIAKELSEEITEENNFQINKGELVETSYNAAMDTSDSYEDKYVPPGESESTGPSTEKVEEFRYSLQRNKLIESDDAWKDTDLKNSDTLNESIEDDEDCDEIITDDTHCAKNNDSENHSFIFEKPEGLEDEGTLVGDAPFKCIFCDKRFRRQESCYTHILTHTRPFKCCACDKCFSRRSTLVKHMSIHTKDRPFKCSFCGQYFTDENLIVDHMITHMKEKPFKCQFCDKSFSQNNNLVVHMRTHTKEKPFKCTVCQKGFTSKSHITYHMRTHTKEKPFKCSICEKCFTQNVHLRNHMRLHTNEKPFKCNVCGRCFGQKSQMLSHMKIHGKEKPYKCKICSGTFKKKTGMAKHMRIHSNIETVEVQQLQGEVV